MNLHLFDNSENEARELSALTLRAGPHELRLLADFLNSCADDIDTNGSQYEHRHFKHEPAVSLEESTIPDIQISRCV